MTTENRLVYQHIYFNLYTRLLSFDLQLYSSISLAERIGISYFTNKVNWPRSKNLNIPLTGHFFIQRYEKKIIYLNIPITVHTVACICPPSGLPMLIWITRAMKTSALHSSNLLKCKWSNRERVTGKQLSNAPAGTGTLHSYLSIIYFQWVELFGIFSEVLRMPRIAGFLFIQVKEVFNSIFFWWHLLQLVTPNYSAHTTPGSKHPVPTEVKHEKKNNRYKISDSRSQYNLNWFCNNHTTVNQPFPYHEFKGRHSTGEQQKSHHRAHVQKLA